MTDIQRIKIKLKLKEWELNFQEKNGRKPMTDDIAVAPPNLKEMYRSYFKMKKQTCTGGTVSAEGQKATRTPDSNFWSENLNKSNTNKKPTAKVSPSVIGTYVDKLQANYNVAVLNRKRCTKPSVQPGPICCFTEDDRRVRSDNPVVSSHSADVSDVKLSAVLKGNFKVNIKPETAEIHRCWKAVNVLSGTDIKLHSRSSSLFIDQVQEDAIKVVMGQCDTADEGTKGNAERKQIDEDFNSTSTLGSGGGHTAEHSSADVVTSASTEIHFDDSYTGLEKTDRCRLGSASTSSKAIRPLRVAAGCEEVLSKLSGKRSRNNSDAKNVVRPSKIMRSATASASSSNYVRINLKKRVYSRGKKQFNFCRFKYGRWKQLQHEKQPFKECTAQELDALQSESHSGSDSDLEVINAEQGSSPSLAVATSEENAPSEDTISYLPVEPMFELINDELPKSAEASLHQSLELFGHTEFRDWQLQVIARILAGKSTLVIQPTGAGKSLSYLLPAYVYSQRSLCITLVISPLVALMQDQMMQVPSCLKAACLHSNMTDIQKEKVKDAISRGKVNVLFMSPEGLVAATGSTHGYLPSVLPPVAFVCIDEVHCISAWSHNFRPTYLRLCRVVRETMKVRCVLGLTATATTATIENVAHHLGVEVASKSVVRGTVFPSNLHLTVSRDQGEEGLLALLREEPFLQCRSVIVYCIRRDQTERLATLIRTCFQDKNWNAEAYHAGLTAARRRAIQNHFMSGQLRVVVATVAFGMGINKADVRAVIHYNMPKSIETYVQEIGRAGRDGQPSYCHLFLDLNGEDKQELKRHIYADTVDRAALAKLLKWIFTRCKCHRLHEMEEKLLQAQIDGVHVAELQNKGIKTWRCSGHEIAFAIDAAVEELDMKAEAIETLIHYLELHRSGFVKLLNPIYDTCNLFCYGGAGQLANLVTKFPLIAPVMALNKKGQNKEGTNNSLEFSLVKLATTVGCETAFLRRQVRKLQWDELKGSHGETKYIKSGIVVNFKDLSFHLKAAGDLAAEELDDILNDLHRRVLQKEKMELEKLENFYSVLNKASFAHHWACEGEAALSKSQFLKDVIAAYFDDSSSLSSFVSSWHLNAQQQVDSTEVERVSAEVRRFLSIYSSEYHFAGRNIARIFHGIGSPRYPAETWGRVRQFWRSHLNFDFNLLCKLATEHLLQFR